MKGSPPVIDIQHLFSNAQELREPIIQSIGKACEEWGFFHVINHGISEKLIKQTLEEMKSFFQLSLDLKLKVKRTATNSRGFANDELTKQKRDWKEIFDFGNLDLGFSEVDGVNQWPAELPLFKKTMKEYYEANAKLAKLLMEAISLSLNTDPQQLIKAFDNHTSFARLNYYPVLTSSSSLGISRHTDAGGLTILWQSGPGLQVYSG